MAVRGRYRRADRCGKRLAPFLDELVPVLADEGLVPLSASERTALIAMSAATIDRRLAPFRRQRQPFGRGTTKPGRLLKQQGPIRTYTPWAEERPGFLEIDLVAPCGTTTAGHYLNTLVATDIATGWTECQAIWGKGQTAVVDALEQIRERLPFPLLGLDSDNGSEFLNAHLLRWCAAGRITFTRSRPYWKNDQAHVEQKTWSVIRKLIGYDRYESHEALATLLAAYAPLRLWSNHWQPTLELIAKARDGGRVRTRYDTAATPYRRVLALASLGDDGRNALSALHASDNPITLRRRLTAAILRLDRCRTRPTGPATEVAGEHPVLRQRSAFSNTKI